MFRSYKQQSPHKVSRQKKSSDEQNLQVSAPVHPTLQMQSLIGNHATQRMIQRMPTHGVIISQLGQPKAHATAFGRVIKKNSTRYRAVLDAVKAYDNFLNNTVIGTTKSEKQGQFTTALGLLNTVQSSMAVYDGKKDAKALYFASIKGELEKEKSKLATSAIKVVNSTVNYANFGKAPRPKFGILLTPDVTTTLKESDVVGGDKGGTSEVTEFGGRNAGFFKGNKSTLYNPVDGLEPIQGETQQQKEMRGDEESGKLQERLMEEFGASEGSDKFNALNNEHLFGVKTAGINSQDARMAKRDVATSRLNQLLGESIIAKAQLSIKQNGNGTTTEGSLMEKATGKSGDKLAREGGLYDEAGGETKDAGNAKQISLQDPKLMQLFSKLQLIDQLAFQVDRNVGNYYIQTDPTGKVIGLTGIDNDFSFGEATDVTKRNNTLPALSKYADEETAVAIINLDPELLKVVMADLLSPGEISALVTRLTTMQVHLKELQSKGELLKPGQWGAAMAQKLLDETTGKGAAFNYYQQLVKTRPKPPKPK